MEFDSRAGLPGGVTAVALLHDAIGGLLLDPITEPIDSDGATEQIVDALVDRLLPVDDG